jgi:hypothetical protein
LVGVTRVAFPFLAVNLRGISLETVGTMVSLSRLTDTCGRYLGGRLCDRIKPAWVILLGVAIGIPMLLLQAYGSGFLTLLIPLAVTTMGFGFTNVGATTFALQSANPGAKELALGISRPRLPSARHRPASLRRANSKYGIRRWIPGDGAQFGSGAGGNLDRIEETTVGALACCAPTLPATLNFERIASAQSFVVLANRRSFKYSMLLFA